MKQRQALKIACNRFFFSPMRERYRQSTIIRAWVKLHGWRVAGSSNESLKYDESRIEKRDFFESHINTPKRRNRRLRDEVKTAKG